MSWPPADASEADKRVARIRSYSERTSDHQRHPQEEQQHHRHHYYGAGASEEKIRLPPLSSLISSSSHTSTPPFHRTSPNTTSLNPLRQQHPQQQYQHQHPHHHHHQEQRLLRHGEASQRFQSLSPLLSSSASLAPLNSLTIHRNTRSPQLYTGSKDLPPPPRLPSASSSSSSSSSLYTYSPHDVPRRPRVSDSASPSTKPSVGPMRRRWTGGGSGSGSIHSSTSTRPYDRRSMSTTTTATNSPPPPPPNHRQSSLGNNDYFNHVRRIYTYACRINDDEGDQVGPNVLQSHRRRTSYPFIAEGNIEALTYHLNIELEQLSQFDPRLSLELAQEAGLNNNSNKTYRSPSLSINPSPSPRNRIYEDGPGQRQETYSLYNPPPPPSRILHHVGMPGSSSSSIIQEHGRHQHSINIHQSPILHTSPMISHTYQSSKSSSSAPPPPPPLSTNLSSLSSSSTSSTTTKNNTSTADTASAATAAAAANTSSTTLPPKRVRKRKDEVDQSCLSCSATETPEWRKGPTGNRTLCNACGLLYAKQLRKKEADSTNQHQDQNQQREGKSSRPSFPLDHMSLEEKEKSLSELKLAVKARSNDSPP